MKHSNFKRKWEILWIGIFFRTIFSVHLKSESQNDFNEWIMSTHLRFVINRLLLLTLFALFCSISVSRQVTSHSFLVYFDRQSTVDEIKLTFSFFIWHHCRLYLSSGCWSLIKTEENQLRCDAEKWQIPKSMTTTQRMKKENSASKRQKDN